MGERIKVRGMPQARTKIVFARTLRNRQTDAERILWMHLANRRLQGTKFRRQQPIGPYIVDFVSFEASLIVELDGGQHNEDKEKVLDQSRTEWLHSEGFRVLRFWNDDVLKNTVGILEEILRNITLTPTLSPPGRGSKRKTRMRH